MSRASVVAVANALRVLLVEDNPDDAVLLERALKRQGIDCQVERVETAEGMHIALDRRPWDIVLSDFTMPRFSGMAAFELLKNKDLDIPFIFVSGTVGEDVAVKAMKLGASDYLLKGNLARLGPAIQREIRERDSREARARAERELRQSEERYGALFEAAPFPMWVFDRESLAVLAVNDEAIHHYGYSREEFLSMTIADLRPPEDAEQFREDGSSPGPDRGTAWRHRRKDGSLIRVEVKAHDLDFAGRGARLVAVNDVTERFRAEQALVTKEEQLRQSQKMEAVGRLAGGVAHDFNNMLSVILSYSEIVASGLHPDDPNRADLAEIRDAGRRAADLTRQLLLFSRQQVVERQVFDVNRLLADMGKLLRRIVGEDVELVFRPCSSPARIRGNRGHVEQVLMNLAVNARDAMPAGGKVVIESAGVLLADTASMGALYVVPGPYVRIAVTDSGIGMDRATRERIFEPFFTTKERGKGTGLGLSTVFGIMQQSDGTIEVVSAPGKGTTFNVYFPRVDAPVEVSALTSPPPSVHGTETVLVVEDEDRVRAVARSILRRLGYDVLDASSPEEALAICEKHEHIDVLLSDVVMPRISGPELSKLIAKRRPGIRIVFMSGYTDESLGRYAFDATVDLLPKPFTPESLARKVREVLDRPEILAVRKS